MLRRDLKRRAQCQSGSDLTGFTRNFFWNGRDRPDALANCPQGRDTSSCRVPVAPALAVQGIRRPRRRPRWTKGREFVSLVIITLIRCRLAELNLRRHFRVHQRSTTICKYYLTGDPVGLWGTKESHDISNVRRRAESTHWCPTLLMPVANQLLH